MYMRKGLRYCLDVCICVGALLRGDCGLVLGVYMYMRVCACIRCQWDHYYKETMQ